ncbi:MAG: virginiamycin A acetyltransferase [Moritella dasanensis]|jgi:virginiamycin A acetyltransferase
MAFHITELQASIDKVFGTNCRKGSSGGYYYVPIFLHFLKDINLGSCWCNILGNGWEKAMPKEGELPFKGDTEIGNDVWIGYDATIMPGVKMDHGAIVASKSVVTKDIASYSVCGGNPAVHIKQRFEQSAIDELLRLEWWNWSPEKITANINAIMGGDLSALQRAE